MVAPISLAFFLFQSTLPVGGATSDEEREIMKLHYFNPRSPWGERLKFTFSHRNFITFQSTLPVGGATLQPGDGNIAADGFQSTLPVGGATGRSSFPVSDGVISIHAPRGGSDRQQSGFPTARPYFNPRSPWGERQETRIRD